MKDLQQAIRLCAACQVAVIWIRSNAVPPEHVNKQKGIHDMYHVPVCRLLKCS